MRSRPPSAAAASETTCCSVDCACSPEHSDSAETSSSEPSVLRVMTPSKECDSRRRLHSSPELRPHLFHTRQPLQGQRVPHLLPVQRRWWKYELHLWSVHLEVAHEPSAHRCGVRGGKLVMKHRPTLWLDDVSTEVRHRALPRGARLFDGGRGTSERLASGRWQIEHCHVPCRCVDDQARIAIRRLHVLARRVVETSAGPLPHSDDRVQIVRQRFEFGQTFPRRPL